MRIACVGYMHGKGGAERQLIMLANALSIMGHEVSLIVMAQCNIQYNIDEKIKVINLSAEEKLDRFKMFTRYRVLFETYVHIRPDVSIHFWLQSAYLSAFMPKKIRGKLIYSERTDPLDASYSGIVTFLRNVSFQIIDGFVFQTTAAQMFFEKNKRVCDKSIVIANPIKIADERFSTVSSIRDKRIVSVGRLVDRKNHKYLIEAFATIINEFPEYTLEIYGEGELRNQLEMQIEMLGLKEKVLLKGNKDNIFECIYAASLFVLPSESEGMPNALIEAMALGVPCISTDCKPGGAKALIRNGENGFIVPLDDVDELADRMSFMLMNPDAAEKMAQNAMNIRNTHAPEVIYDIWEKFIMQTIGDE